MYDFIIVGGGPAGSTLARLLNKNFKVLLIEKTGENSDGKICGGLIAPDAQRMLGKFNLTLPQEILVDPQMFYVESTDLKTNNSQKYQRFYLNINRKKFDNWLLSLPEVEILRETRYVSHKIDEQITVKLESKGILREVETRYLVGADGSQSVVRRNVFKDFESINKYISIQSEIQCKNISPCFEVYFDKRITDFYGWAIPKGENNLIGIALKGKDAKSKYELFLKSVLKEEYKEISRNSTLIIRPRKNTDFKISYKNRVFLIGEAAGFISPSSAEGFSYAFKSAEALALSINSGSNIEQKYKRNCKKIKRELFFKRVKSIVMYNQILRNIVFKLGINKL